MTDIPEDIIQAARSCYRGTALGSVYTEAVELIARAILAERQACEKIAREREQAWASRFGTTAAIAHEAEALVIADLIAARSSS